MNYWLMKCEPEAYSIEDLEKDQVAFWEGVRNYQARNIMRDQMKPKDLAFYYHSNAKPSGIAGLMEIVSVGYPDETALDEKSKYYDPKAQKDKPIWYGVDVKFIKKLPQVISLKELKEHSTLSQMMVTQKGSRLSVQPVTEKEFNYIRRTYGF